MYVDGRSVGLNKIGPNFGHLYANGQVFPKVATLPLLFAVAGIKSYYLLDGSNSPSMRVDGSSVQKVFEYVIPLTNYFAFAQFNLIMVDTAITPSKFGGQAALANGCLIQVLNAANEVIFDFSPANISTPFKANYQFYHIAGTQIAQSSGQDFVAVSWQSPLLGVLGALSPGDKVRVTVRDNLTGMVQFQASIHGALLANDVSFVY